MILTYKDCIKKYGSDYMIKKELEQGKLFQKSKGVYSEEENCSELEIITVKYPRAVFAGAFRRFPAPFPGGLYPWAEAAGRRGGGA